MADRAQCRTRLSDDLRPVFVFHVRFSDDRLPALDGWPGNSAHDVLCLPSCCCLLGAAGFYAGLFSNHIVLVIATASTLAGWGTALYALLRVLLDTQHPDKRHPTIIFIALSLGWCSLAAYLIWLFSDNAAYLRFAIQGGLWLFLLPVFASVAHRMLPFFTSSALPQYVDQESGLAMVDHTGGKRDAYPAATRQRKQLAMDKRLCPVFCGTLFDLLPGAFSAACAYHCSAYCTSVLPGWGLPCCCSASRNSCPLLNDGSIPVWGLAPLHALTIGCFATLLIGMGTRVTLGHSGLPMQVDRPIMLMFAGIQLAALLRILADMLPNQSSYWLYVAAAAVWLACFSPWVLRYLPVYWRPRVDGQTG